MISSYETRDWTTVNAKWVQKWKPAITFGLSEEIGQFECFDKDTKSQAEDSVCSLTWKNRMHIFGGVANSNGGHSSYISRLNGFKLEYLKSLSFSFTRGACSTTKDEIYLCFYKDGSFGPNSPSNLCKRATSLEQGVNFTEVARSNYHHEGSKISASDGK